jgi:23S rRNA G2445 N2-methylase RlmL
MGNIPRLSGNLGGGRGIAEPIAAGRRDIAEPIAGSGRGMAEPIAGGGEVLVEAARVTARPPNGQTAGR